MIRRLFFDDVGLKLVAVSLAIVLEVFFYSEDMAVESVILVPVKIVGLPPGMTIVSPPEGEHGLSARVVVRGPRPIVEQVRRSLQVFTARVPADERTSFRVVLNAAELRLPPQIQLLEIEPRTIAVQLDKLVRKQLVVVVQRTGTPPEGFQVNEHVAPESVLAEGPESELEKVQRVTTEPVDISDLRESREVNLALVSPGRLTRLSDTVVTVEFKVREIGEERVIERVPVSLEGADGTAASLEPAVVRVVVTGPRSVIETLKKTDVGAQVSVATYGPGRHLVKPEVHLPKDVDLVAVSPDRVTLTVLGPEHATE